jgi:Ca2+/H+ antiporter
MSANKEGQPRSIFSRLRPLDSLLLAVPLAFFLHFVPAWKNETLLFFISGAALIPLAAWLGRATEHLSARAGPGVGGSLNATLGNAPELILSLAALSKGLIVVVKASISGAILGNILLVSLHCPRTGSHFHSGDERVCCRIGRGRLQVSRSNGGFRRGHHCRDHRQCK